MSLDKDRIRMVEFVWKIDIFQRGVLKGCFDRVFESIVLNWPRTEHYFICFLCVSKEKNFVRLDKTEDSPFTLCGTISAVTAEKSEHVLWQFENWKFSKERKSYIQSNSIDFQHLMDSFISNKTLTLRIHLWNPCIKDSNIPTYFIQFQNKFEKCSFPWIIKRNCSSKQVIEVPRDFHYNEKVFNLLLALELVNTSSPEESDLEFEITLKNPYVTRFSEIVYLKCKIESITGEVITLDSDYFFWLRVNGGVHKLPIDEEFISKINSNSLAENITLHCHITVKNPYIIGLESVNYLPQSSKPIMKKILSGDHERTENETTSKDTLKDCMYRLYKEGQFCDAILATQEKKFPCHKNVLCCRSSVFRAMFESDMKEKESGLIDIIDADPETLDLFLTALYTDEIEELDWKNAMNVYIIADKYDVELIRKKCTDYLASNLSSSNVCDLLELADSHQDENLKDSVEKFFFRHAKEIIKSSHWTTLMSKNIELAALMMQKVFTISD